MKHELEIQELTSVYNDFADLHDIERQLWFNNDDQLAWLASSLTENSKILDTGCGTGFPVIKFFNDLGHNVTGTDIANKALEYVNVHAPGVETVVCDTAEIDFPSETFDLITSFYSFMHLPLDRQIMAFENFYRMGKPNSQIYVTLACEEYTGKPEFAERHNYLGYPLPIYHFTLEKYREILNRIGYKNISFEKKDTGKNITLAWVHATK